MLSNLFSLFPGLSARKWFKILVLAAVAYLGVAGSCGFACFIFEEAAQARSFGPYMLIQAKLWPEAQLATDEVLKAWRRDSILVTILSIPVPLGRCYRSYFEAEKMKLDNQMKRIEYELAQMQKKVDNVSKYADTQETIVTRKYEIPLSDIDLTQNEKTTSRDITLTPGRVDQLERMSGYVRTFAGKCYHMTDCSVMSGKEAIKVSEEEVKAGKYRPCKKCLGG
jgi:hypothetical protein